MDRNVILKDSRFVGMEPFEKKVWLSSPTMHGEELKYVLNNCVLSVNLKKGTFDQRGNMYLLAPPQVLVLQQMQMISG